MYLLFDISEVNGHRLLGMNHIEVVSILKELPIGVRMVCGRGPPCPPDMYIPPSPPRGKLGGSLQNLMPTTDRLVKGTYNDYYNLRNIFEFSDLNYIILSKI